MTATSRLALCTILAAFAAGGALGCDQDNPSTDVIVGADDSPDTTRAPDTSNGDSTMPENTEPAEVCAEYAHLEGTTWECSTNGGGDKTPCIQTFWEMMSTSSEPVCWTKCSINEDNFDFYEAPAFSIEWHEKDYVFDITGYTVTCTLVEK